MPEIKKGIYRHYKGKEYEVLGIAKYESTLEDLVLYKPLYEQNMCDYWVRPVANFVEDVEWEGKKMPRFEFIKEKEEIKRPQVGVGVIIKKDKKILFQKRIGAHGANTYSLPGGHLEFAENLEECAKREIEEETGLIIDEPKFFAVTNDYMQNDNKHYITIFMIANHVSGEPEIKEPKKCADLFWCDWKELPTPLFKPIENLLKQGLNPFEK